MNRYNLLRHHALKTGTSSFATRGLDDTKAMTLGDAAVVVGRTKLQATRLVTPVDGTSRFTDTFDKRDGRWQAVASQVTRIAKP